MDLDKLTLDSVPAEHTEKIIELLTILPDNVVIPADSINKHRRIGVYSWPIASDPKKVELRTTYFKGELDQCKINLPETASNVRYEDHGEDGRKHSFEFNGFNYEITFDPINLLR